MAQDFFTSSVSESALAILKKHTYMDWYNEKPSKIIASLYARRGNADPKVLKCLHNDIYSFTKEEGDALCAEYTEVIKHCFESMRHHNVNSRKNGSIELPQSLLNIVSGVISANPETRVFIPFAGKGDLALSAPGCIIDGTEINPRDWALSQILFDALGLKGGIRLLKDPEKALDFKGKADVIFSAPPISDGRKEYNRCEALAFTIASRLSEGGTACILVPTPILSGNTWKPLRKYMLSNVDGLVSTVVALPSILRPFTVVEQSLVIIRKQENSTGTIKFFNGLDKSFYQPRRFNDSPYVLKAAEILQELNNPTSAYAALVSSSAINEDSNFTADRFFVQQVLPELKEGERLVKLSELVDVPAPEKPGKDIESARIVSMQLLSFKYLTSAIDVTKTYKDAPKGCYKLFPGTILVGYMGGKFKVGQTPETLSEPAVLRPEVVQFYLKPDAPISKDFLLRSLMSEYVRNQAHMLDAGATITRLSKDDLFSLQIIVPSKEEQDRLVFSDGVAGMSQADQEKVKFFSEFRKDMHMKKHAIGQTIFNLNNWLMNLADAREECHGILDDNAEVGGVVKIKVADIYENISLAMQILDKQISTLDVGYGMKSTSIKLDAFISDYIASHPIPLVKYDFSRATTSSDADGSGEESLSGTIEFPKEALTIIFDNIIANAVSHGFSNDAEHTIRFSVEVEGTNIVVSVANDGSPLPADQNPEDIFIYGVSEGGRNHLGIGAYQVRNLMREFDGDAEIISTPEEDFTVTYRLIFTKTTLNDSE